MTDSRDLRLKVLVYERHWQSYRTFQQEYDRAAAQIDPGLVGSGPSRAQLFRWLAGDLKGLPYADHCRVLERMFPGWTAERLFEPWSLGEHGTQSDNGSGGRTLSLINEYTDLQAALAHVVEHAEEAIATTGSRSRDPDYLSRLEAAVAARPTLVHYRVLYGPPRHSMLKNHLRRLHDIAGNGDRLRIGIVRDLYRDPERFLCVSERAAIVVLPSLTSTSNFDSGILITDTAVARHYLEHVRQAYLGSDQLTTRAALDELEVLR